MAGEHYGVMDILVYSGLERLGDGIIKLPFVRALRQTWPAARITWLAGKGETVYAGSLRPLVRYCLDEGIENAGIAPGAGGAHKRWPLERFLALARQQAQAGRVPAFLLGPEEAAWRDEIAAAVPAACFPLQAEAAPGDAAAAPLVTIAVARNLA